MRKMLKKAAVLLFAGMALIGTGSMAARAEVITESTDLLDPSSYWRLCHTDGWYYNEYTKSWGSSKRDGICVFGYDGPDENLVIPETLDGFTVVSVSDQDPTLSNTAQISRNVKSITIPKDIKEFNYYESEGGGDEGKYPGTYHGRPILGLKNLERYEVSADNSVYKSVDGVLFSKDGKYLVNYPPSKKGTSYDVPDGVEYVCVDAFWENKYLKTVVFPDSVKLIGSAFGYSENLKQVFIPASVKQLDSNFENAVVYCQKGSFAEETLKKYKGKYKSYAKPSKTGTVTAKAGKSGKAVLSFKPVSKASGYEIYKSGSQYGGWEQIKATVVDKKGKKTCNVSLKGEIGAWYRVRAYKKAGPGRVYGSYSKPVRVLVKPEAVQEVYATRSSRGKVSVRWDSLADRSAPGCSGYQIYRYDSSSKKYKKVATVKSGYEDWYLDEGLKAGRTYSYKVRAYNSQGGKKAYGAFSKPTKTKA